MLDDLMMFLIVLAGLFVFVASLCRVNYLHLRTHQPLWVGAYALVAVWAAIEALDALMFAPDGATLVGLVGVGLWLWGSRLSWREGAPAYLEKQTPCR